MGTTTSSTAESASSPSGGLADVYTVFATVDRSLGTKGITCFIVEKDRPGVSVGKAEDKMGMVLSNTTDLLFENVRIPQEPGGRGGQGLQDRHDLPGPQRG